MHTSNVFSVTLFVLLNLCNTAQAGLKEEITARNNQLQQLYKKGKVDEAAKFYDENAVFMITKTNPLIGPAAIKEHFSKDHGLGIPDIKLKVDEINGEGKWAFERGSFNVTWKKNNKKSNGTYLKVWKKNENNDWVVYADSTNYIKLPPKPETK